MTIRHIGCSISGMAGRETTAFASRALLLALLFARAAASPAAETNIESQLQLLQQQNELLQSQLRQQQELIDSLRRDVAGIQAANDRRDAEIANEKPAVTEPEEAKTSGFSFGTVQAERKTETQDDSGGGAYASRKYKFAERVNYADLHDFVVYINGSVGTNGVIPPSKPVVISSTRVTQQGAMFNPHVLPVVAGVTVQWPNNDQIFHNVFSMSETTNFDLGLYKGNPPEKKVTFNKAGRADVFCPIHANMHCIVLVLENPYFSPVDGQNHYSISNIPPGRYKVKAWHERIPAQVKEITVPETGAVKADFVLGFNTLPKL